MKVTPDSTHRIVLTREMRDALSLMPGQPLNVSITPGAVLLTPMPLAKGKLVNKRKLKIYRGKIPNLNVEEAIAQTRSLGKNYDGSDCGRRGCDGEAHRGSLKNL